MSIHFLVQSVESSDTASHVNIYVFRHHLLIIKSNSMIFHISSQGMESGYVVLVNVFLENKKSKKGDDYLLLLVYFFTEILNKEMW